MDLDWQHIHHMAKWICIFCFEMKGSVVFDWTVLRCDHLVCIKCQEEHRLSEDHAHLPVWSNISRKCVRLYCDAYSHQKNGSKKDIINSFLSLLRHFFFYST